MEDQTVEDDKAGTCMREQVFDTGMMQDESGRGKFLHMHYTK